LTRLMGLSKVSSTPAEQVTAISRNKSRTSGRFEGQFSVNNFSLPKIALIM